MGHYLEKYPPERFVNYDNVTAEEIMKTGKKEYENHPTFSNNIWGMPNGDRIEIENGKVRVFSRAIGVHTFKKPQLGVLGGMGTLATRMFGRIIEQHVDNLGGKHGLHIDYFGRVNDLNIPDRTQAILKGDKKSYDAVLKALAKTLARLESSDVEVIAMPCNTAHHWYTDLQKMTKIPIINMIEEVAKQVAIELENQAEKRVVLFSTQGTIAANLYQDELAKLGIEVIIPEEHNQQEITTFIFDHIKNGLNDLDRSAKDAMFKDRFALVTRKLARASNNAPVILGCTELSWYAEQMKGDKRLPPCTLIDSSQVLAKVAIEKCGYKYKEEPAPRRTMKQAMQDLLEK